MALQQDNLMLLEVDSTQPEFGLPRTMSATDSIGLSGDLIVGGDLTVDGDIVSVGTRDVVVTDNYLDLNNGNIASAKSGGLTVQVQANNSQAGNAGTGTTFESKATSATGNARFKVDGIDFSAIGAAFAVNDIISISGFSDAGENNGLFTIASIGAGAGGWVEVKGSNTAEVPFCQTDFEDATEDLAGSAIGYTLDLGVVTISDGTLPDGAGGTVGKGSFATGYAENANDQPFNSVSNTSGFKYGDAATVSLQEAYDAGRTINLADSVGDLLISTDATGPAFANFQVQQAATGQMFLASDADNALVALGHSTGATNDLAVAIRGHLIEQQTRFLGVGDLEYSLQTDNATDSLLVQGHKKMTIESIQAAVDTQTLLKSQGQGVTASLTAAAAYVGGASVAGNLTGEIFDKDGTASALTIGFTAGEADLAALIAAATVPASVTLSDDGTGKLVITSVQGGSRVNFKIDGESVGGVGTSLGIAASNPSAGSPYSSNNGSGSVNVEALASGMNVIADGNIDMLSMSRGMKLTVQTAGKVMQLDAAGALDMDSANTTLDATTTIALNSGGNTSLDTSAGKIDLTAVGGKVELDSDTGIDIGVTTASAVDVNATSVTIDGTLNSNFTVNALGQSLSLETIGGGAAQALNITGGGTGAAAISIQAASGGVDLDGEGVDIASTGAANNLALSSALNISATAGVNGAITLTGNATGGNIELNPGGAGNLTLLKGYIAQDVTGNSSGVGASFVFDGAAGAGVTSAGQIMTLFNNTGANPGAGQAKAVGAGDAEAVSVVGVFTESAVAANNPVKCHTAHGFSTELNFGGSSPAATDSGKPVYLSATAGQATLSPPISAGSHVVRLGFAVGNGDAVIWAPQYIAKRP